MQKISSFPPIIKKDSKILILGITFKENCPDIRNTKIVDIYHTLTEYTENITIFDPYADIHEVKEEYELDVVNGDLTQYKGQYDTVILAVAHNEFKNIDLRSFLKDNGVVYDVKGIADLNQIDGRL